MFLIRRMSCLVPAMLIACSGAVAPTRPTAASAPDAVDGFANPLLPSGPDPWIVAHGGIYYYTHTLGDRIALWRTRDITRLADAEQRTVWRPPATGPNAHAIWAPELHRIRGRWYIYYTATEADFRDDRHRGVFVLENGSPDPLQGIWIDRGRVNTARPGIDGTVFAHRGTLYFAYSPYIGTTSGIAIARMRDPWTIAGDEVVIAEPDRPWEDRGGRRILEGPEFLAGPTGLIFLTYSAGACWSDDYALGLLSARPGGNLLDRTTWTKAATPILAGVNGIYATGHNGFFRSPDGREQWIVYHANPGPGMGCTRRRAPHVARLSWSSDGAPQVPPPAPAGHRARKPSGTTMR